MKDWHRRCSLEIVNLTDSPQKSESPAQPVTPSTHSSHAWASALKFGMLFEVVLVLLLLLLPKDSWLFVRVFNFVILFHYPLLRFLEHVSPESVVSSVLLTLFIGLLMGLFWAVCFGLSRNLIARGSNRLRLSKRQKRILGYNCALLGIAVSAAVLFDALNNGPKAFTASPKVRSIVAGTTAFALDLYHQLAQRPGNLFFSPQSISTSLAVIYAGARGQTEAQIARTAHFDLPQNTLHPAFGELVRRLHKVQRWNRIQLTVANSVWCQQGHPFSNAFLSVARAYYGADARLADLRGNPQHECARINSWVSKSTKGKISAIIQPEQLTTDSSLVLCNAIYFKGKWAMQFKPANTRSRPFFVATNQTVTVPMMSQHSDFRTAQIEAPAMKLIELPYYGGDLSMVILLPETIEGLGELEKELTGQNFAAWLSSLDRATPRKTWVAVPRFTSSQSFEISKMLQSLDMPAAFNDSSDFSGIDGSKNLFISSAVHKAWIEVNEAGTEAAAATLHVVSKSASDRFNADHPFVFLIRDNASGAILFLGRMVDPSKGVG